MFMKADISGQKVQLKGSAVKSIIREIVALYPGIEENISEIIDAKSTIHSLRLEDRTTLLINNGRVVFFQPFKASWIPHLTVVHAFPKAFPSITCDAGAARAVGLRGVRLFSAGFSTDGTINVPEDAEEGEVFALYTVGRENACALVTMDDEAEAILRKDEGTGFTVLHCLGDQLWSNRRIN